MLELRINNNFVTKNQELIVQDALRILEERKLKRNLFGISSIPEIERFDINSVIVFDNNWIEYESSLNESNSTFGLTLEEIFQSKSNPKTFNRTTHIKVPSAKKGEKLCLVSITFPGYRLEDTNYLTVNKDGKILTCMYAELLHLNWNCATKNLDKVELGPTAWW